MKISPLLNLAMAKNQIAGDEWEYLRRVSPRHANKSAKEIRIVDLFSGCGGMSLGVSEACIDQGYKPQRVLAVDIDKPALNVYKENFKDAAVICDSVANLFLKGENAPLSEEEKALAKQAGRVDFLIGGPPCQGHSNLNNFSRRNDPKNSLYFYMARAAAVFSPKAIIIENVTGAAHDVSGIVGKAASALERMGYRVEMGTINALRLGIPQSRKRLILIASKASLPSIAEIEKAHSQPERDLKWAIEDLKSQKGYTPFDMPAKPSADNEKRIGYLFANRLYDLPNSERPRCHRDKPHSYNSVYGRLSWNKPAQTITSGFYSMCMGRYVHPSKPRTLTAHEAARIQFFPDSFDFSPVQRRTHLATIIGNAVPMKISYAIATELLRSRK